MRVARSPAYGELSGWVDEHYGGHVEFGGAWLDQQKGGTFVVAATSQDALDELVDATRDKASDLAAKHDGHSGGLSELLGIDLELTVTGHLVDHSLATLRQSTDLVGETFASLDLELDAGDLVLEPMSNRVVVSLLVDYSEEVRGTLVSRSEALPGVELVERTWTSTDPSLAACPLSGCGVQGAVKHDSVNTFSNPNYTGECSIGFTGVRNGEVGFYSAGHCYLSTIFPIDNSNPLPHYIFDGNGNPLHVGTGKRYVKAGGTTTDRVDVSFVALNSTGLQEAIRGQHWSPFGWSPAIIAPHLTKAEATIGDFFCRSGYRTEDDHLNHCGQLYANYPRGYVSNTTACPGDSGGPFFRASDHMAVGITEAIPNQTQPIPCPTNDMSFVTFTFLSVNLGLIGGTIDSGK